MEIPLVNIADSDVKLLCEDGTRPADSSNAAADAFDVQEEECWGGTTCAVSQGFTVVGVMQVDPLEKKTSCLFVDCDSISGFTNHDSKCMSEARADQSDKDMCLDGEQDQFQNIEEWLSGSIHNEEEKIDEETLPLWSGEARKKSDDDKEMEHMQNDDLSESLGESLCVQHKSNDQTFKMVVRSQIENTSLNLVRNLSLEPLVADIMAKDCSMRGLYGKVGCGIFSYACHTVESVQAALWTHSSVKWCPSNAFNTGDLPLKECRVMIKDLKNSQKENLELHGLHGECVTYKKIKRARKSNSFRNLKTEAFLPEIKKCIVLVEDIGSQSGNLFHKRLNKKCYPFVENRKLSRKAAVKLRNTHTASVTHAKTVACIRSKPDSKYTKKLGLPECFVKVEDVQRQSDSSSFFKKKVRKECYQFPRNKTPALPNLEYFKDPHLKECSVLVEHAKLLQVSSRKKTGHKTTTLFNEEALQKKCFVLLKDILRTESLRKKRPPKQSHKLYADKFGFIFRGGASKVLIKLQGLSANEGTKVGQARMPKLAPHISIPHFTKMAGVTDNLKNTDTRECSVVLEKSGITSLQPQSLLLKKGVKTNQARMPKSGHPISVPLHTKTTGTRDSLKNINLRECSVVLDRMHEML